MKSGSDLLGDLFANVRDPAEQVNRGGGRILPRNRVVFDATSPITNPREWLGRFQIPIVELPKERLGSALAQFRFRSRGPELDYAAVEIEIGSDINAGPSRWYVWHEIGHAVDHVAAVEGKIVAVPHGQFSSKHAALLREHQETIILWSPSSNREYKTQLVELWAEAVACAVCEPQKMPPRLLLELKADLDASLLPIDYTATSAINFLTSLFDPPPLDGGEQPDF